MMFVESFDEQIFYTVCSRQNQCYGGNSVSSDTLLPLRVLIFHFKNLQLECISQYRIKYVFVLLFPNLIKGMS